MDGVNILCDPIFSHRCSPSQWVGPARFTPPPCKLEDLPPIDVVIISHNHYDHMDTSTLKALGPHPHYFYPLGNTPYFSSLKIPAENLHEMDWWDTHHLTLSDNRKVEIVCTPCQHFTGRGVLDRFKTLWASWAVLGQGKRFWFAGDTGYRYVPKDNTDLSLLPVCPAFKEIGAKYGPFDLSCIPIGAYSPRWFMSPIHCSPEDAVEVHKDVRSKKSIGMHWGTFVLTDEPVNEPPVRLKKSAADAGLVEGVFGVIHIGETVQVACPFS
ncbi:beta-lactamase superfamily domain-containing protein [Phlyctochytrium arcticum]|nr:beta-lactamase superfamily domain-containing protein [Phlyctochytrium arcticum]